METTSPHSAASGRRIATAALAMLLVLAASISLRLYPTLASPSLGRMLESPVLIEHDGYYYLRYAKEYCAGAYTPGEPDTLRGAVHELPKPRLPLLSAMACYAHRAAGVSIEHAAMFLPIVLSALICIPLWLYRDRIGGRIAAAVAIVFTLTSPIYIIRTKAGFFDTDCLNVFFMLSVLWLLHHAALCPRWKGVLYAVSGGLVFRLFMWWYDKGVLYYVFTAILIVMLVLCRREGGGLKAGIIKFFAFALVGYAFFGRGPLEFMEAYLSTNVFKAGVVGSLPNVASAVGELASEPLRLSINRLHSEVLVIIACAGVLWLCVSRWRDAIAFLPLLVFGAMGFWGGARYLVYLVPVMGIGLGYLTLRISERAASVLAGRAYAPAWLPALAGAAVSFALVSASPRGAHAYIPLFEKPVHEAFEFLRTQEKGLVWTWWDMGYAIQDVSGQATYVDGGRNNNTYYVGHSLVQSSQREAYDVITNVLKAQSTAARAAGIPARGNSPVYLVFTADMIDIYTWIQYFGNWDLGRGTGDMNRQKRWRLGTFPAASLRGRVSGPEASFNLNDGTLTFQGQMYALKAAHTVYDGGGREPLYREYPYGGDSLFIMEVVVHGEEAEVFLAERDFYDSVFNRMFLLGQYDPEFFDLIYDRSTGARIYKLR